jgi:hypothetical protein
MLGVRRAVLGVGGFDERYLAYLEEVDLALRLGMAGWRCRYEPAAARHAGEGSSIAGMAGTTTWLRGTCWSFRADAGRASGSPLGPIREPRAGGHPAQIPGGTCPPASGSPALGEAAH